jgi:hypothetical protein
MGINNSRIHNTPIDERETYGELSQSLPRGNHLGTIEVPEQPANLVWGENYYQTLYTAATTSVYRLRMKARGFARILNISGRAYCHFGVNFFSVF